MLRSLDVILDYQLAASDGVEGTVADFLFDDESWIVHYLVAETASPLGKRQVLILPFVVGRSDWETKRVPVNLTSAQIRTSPVLESDMPISRQYESGLKLPGSHLRSMREVLGYSIHAVDGEAGTIEDFIVEDTLWGVHHLVVALKRMSGRSVLLSPEAVRSISWRGKAAWVNLSISELELGAEFDPTMPVSGSERRPPLDYYGRPVYTPPDVRP
jgi:hypothetical protein